MDRRNSRQFKSVTAAKLALAVTLLVAFLSSIAPLGPVSAGSKCRLECCAGRAPHASGSCMDGACQAFLLTHSKAARRRQAKQEPGDHFCGLDRAVVVKNVTRMRVNHAPAQVTSDPAPASAAAFVRPCQPDCGACACGFSNPNRQKNSAAIADAVRPRGPKAIHRFYPEYHRTHILDALSRQCAPRGPPPFFS